MKYILDLNNVSLKDIPVVGGKNASLGEMLQHLSTLKIKVPNGFAITVKGYYDFINHNKLDKSIKKLILDLNPNDIVALRKTGLAIRELIRNGVASNNEIITLNDIIKNSKTQWSETEWEFPKGRRNSKERDIDCALREFEEETGINKNRISVIENILPFEEIFIGTNHKSYKHKYFLAYMNENIGENETFEDLDNYQVTEVSKIEWKTLDNCIESIRPYNLEKKKLITNINKVLEEYRLYS